MIVTFCGHADFSDGEKHKKQLLSYLEERVGNVSAIFYLGDYGNFDHFAYACCKEYQSTHPNVKLLFITPYISPSFQKKHLNDIQKRFDEIIYPDIESTPPRYAILHRNRWMVEHADVLVAYITHTYGGAYQTYSHAKRKRKEIFNLFDRNIP